MRSLVLACLAACGFLDGVIAQTIEQVLVKVNGDIITRRDLEERQRAVLAQQHGRAISATDIGADAALKQEAAALAPRLLLDAIDELLMMQRAEDLGLRATNDDVDRVIARMRADNGILTDPEFDRLLREQGIEASALGLSVHRQIVIEQVRQEVFRRLSVADDEAKAFYAANRADFRVGPAVSFREIVVNLPAEERTRRSPEAEAEYTAGLVRFVKARDRVQQGDAFSDVARELSQAPSQAAGGLVGPVDPGTLPDATRAALAKLEVGQISPPVRSDGGYLLLKLEARTAPRSETFDAVHVQVHERLMLLKRDAALSAFIRQLRGAALLSWKDQALMAACAAARKDR